MSYETAVILNQNLAYVPHIMDDSNGRLVTKKSEDCCTSVLCSLLCSKGKPTMCFFTAVCNVFILLQIRLNTVFPHIVSAHLCTVTLWPYVL